MRTLKSIITAVIAVSIINCGSGLTNLANPASQTGTEPANNNPVSQTITNNDGGSIQSGDQKFSLNFPAGSLPENELEITVTPIESDGAMGWDLKPDGLVLDEDATATITFTPSDDFHFDENGVPELIAVLESDDGSELEVVDNIRVVANEGDGTYTLFVPIPHFTKLYVTSGLGSYLEVSKTAGGKSAASIDLFVGDQDTNAMKVKFTKDVFAEAVYPDGKKIRSEVKSSEVTAITVADNGPTTSTVDLNAPITFNDAGEDNGTITTTCDAAGSGDVTVSVTFKQTVEVTSTPGGVIDTREVTKTIEQKFPTNCKAVAAAPAQPQIGVCIQLKITIGGCLNVGTIIDVTLDADNLKLKIEGLADNTLTIDIFEDELTGEQVIEVTSVNFFGLPHTLILYLQDGVVTGFSFMEEGGPGQCEEEALEQQEGSCGN